MTSRRGDLRNADTSIVQCRGDERAVAPCAGEPREIVESADAAAREQGGPACGFADACDQSEIEPSARADAGQVDHNHGAGAGILRPAGNKMRRLAGRDVAARQHRLAITQVEAERHPVAVRAAHDTRNLYLSYRVVDESPWVNHGRDWQQLFKTGDSVDLQLSINPENYSRCVLEDFDWISAKRADGKTNGDYVEARWLDWRTKG